MSSVLDKRTAIVERFKPRNSSQDISKSESQQNVGVEND